MFEGCVNKCWWLNIVIKNDDMNNDRNNNNFPINVNDYKLKNI
jgi:hypothetical protein